jgi:dATP/dGTP diphosphohydrolase, N-terminal
MSLDDIFATHGLKDDTEKIRMDLLSPEALLATAEILTFGAKKYGPRNWEKGIQYGRVYAALQRHLHYFWLGQPVDTETNRHHLAHAMCCVMFLLHYELNLDHYVSIDDRPRDVYVKED